jgi:hypothetical protein
MKSSVPTSSNSSPADLKGTAGSGLTTTERKYGPVSLSLGLKEEIQKIIRDYAANKSSLTHEEFLKFLKEEQQVLLKILN